MPILELHLCAVRTPTFIKASRREVKDTKPAACILMQGTQSINDERWVGFSKRVISYRNSSYKLYVSDICQRALLVLIMDLYVVLNSHYHNTYEMEAGLVHFKV